MKKTVTILICAQLSTVVWAETFYKGRDANGNVIYSDQPIKNSEKIEINLPPPAPRAPPVPSNALAVQSKEIEYQIKIMEPQNDQTFTTDIQRITASLSIQPELAADDRIQILLNNEPYGPLTHTPSFTLEALPRGSYQLQAQIVAKNDPKHPKASSPIITFYQKRAMIKHAPNNP